MKKVCFVSGGCSGLGKQMCLDLDEIGHIVCVVDVTDGTDFSKTLKNSAFFKCDVSDSESVKQCISEIVEKFGRLDWAFNNAGISGVLSKTHNYDEQMFDKLVKILTSHSVR